MGGDWSATGSLELRLSVEQKNEIMIALSHARTTVRLKIVVVSLLCAAGIAGFIALFNSPAKLFGLIGLSSYAFT